MFGTPTSEQAQPQPLELILGRIAAPLLLFSAAFCMLLLMSYMFLLPRFTEFNRSDGVAMSPRALAAYQRSLAADIAQREEERVRLVMPVSDAAYNALKDVKHSTMSLVEVREQLLQAASRLGEGENVLSVDSLTIEGDHVIVHGDVHGVGTRSMTVLAAYVEELTKLPFISGLKRPSFMREGSVDSGFHSPFTVEFTFPASAQ